MDIEDLKKLRILFLHEIQNNNVDYKLQNVISIIKKTLEGIHKEDDNIEKFDIFPSCSAFLYILFNLTDKEIKNIELKTLQEIREILSHYIKDITFIISDYRNFIDNIISEKRKVTSQEEIDYSKYSKEELIAMLKKDKAV